MKDRVLEGGVGDLQTIMEADDQRVVEDNFPCSPLSASIIGGCRLRADSEDPRECATPHVGGGRGALLVAGQRVKLRLLDVCACLSDVCACV